MNFNAKVILLGGLIAYAAMWIVSMISGMVIHEGILDPVYMANQGFWRPELNQDPPDMASLMPRWITTGLIGTFVLAGIYDNIRSAFDGSGMVKGVKFGVVVSLLYATTCAGWSGVFNLPDMLWFWWALEGFVIYVVAGAVLGWFVEKYAS